MKATLDAAVAADEAVFGPRVADDLSKCIMTIGGAQCATVYFKGGAKIDYELDASGWAKMKPAPPPTAPKPTTPPPAASSGDPVGAVPERRRFANSTPRRVSTQTHTQTPAAPSPIHADAYTPDGQRDADGRLILSTRRTLTTATAFIGDHFHHPEGRTLHRIDGQFWTWPGSRWGPIEEALIRNLMQSYLHDAFVMKPGKDAYSDPVPVPFPANAQTVSAAVQAVADYVQIARPDYPCWYPPRAGDLDVRNLVSAPHGIHDVMTGKRQPPTPRLFVTAALEFDPPSPRDSAECPQWLAFVDHICSDDKDVVDEQRVHLLQEWFGYCIVSDNSQQKILLLPGPPRAGKGVTRDVLVKLVGIQNCACPTTSLLASGFGSQTLIGKTLAVVPDARLSGRDAAPVTELVLTISGGDPVTIDKKYCDPMTVRLSTRFMFLTNELPKFGDSSRAIASRFLILQLTKSHLGSEDVGLADRLATELPGIFKWAIEGLHRLRKRGRFIQPASSADAVEDLAELSSPVSAFVKACCVVRPEAWTYLDPLYAAWRRWCESEGRASISIRAVFCRDLFAAFPAIKSRRDDNGRFIEGVELNPQIPE